MSSERALLYIACKYRIKLNEAQLEDTFYYPNPYSSIHPRSVSRSNSNRRVFQQRESRCRCAPRFLWPHTSAAFTPVCLANTFPRVRTKRTSRSADGMDTGSTTCAETASDPEFETLSLLRNRTERCLGRRRALNITRGSFYDPWTYIALTYRLSRRDARLRGFTSLASNLMRLPRVWRRASRVARLTLPRL